MPAPARPIWTGQIRLALVALPVRLYPATESKTRIAFHQIHRETGQRIRYEKVAPGVGAVEGDEIARGYEYKKGRYVLLEKEEIEGVRVESKRTLDLVQFVEAHEIDPLYMETPYYAAPDGALAEDAFLVVRDALRSTQRVGLGQIAMRGRTYAAAVKPCGRGLLVETLRFEDEVRRASAIFADIPDKPSDPELVSLAEELIGRKAAPFDVSRFHDEYADALKRLIERKLEAEGETIVEEAPGVPGGAQAAVSLVEALKRSLSNDNTPRRPSRRAAAAEDTPPPPRRRAAKSAESPAPAPRRRRAEG